MPTIICLQCALESFAQGGPALALVEEDDPLTHAQRRHGDLTPAKRSEFIRLAADRMAREDAEDAK